MPVKRKTKSKGQNRENNSHNNIFFHKLYIILTYPFVRKMEKGSYTHHPQKGVRKNAHNGP